jgi:trk system potassium uptake protein TrkH
LLTRTVVRFTLLVEAAGAVVLYVALVPRLGWKDAAWPAVFHSVNAFCNAGFSTFTDSLIGFQRSPVVLIVVMLLVVAGGLGFLTIEEANLWRRARRGGPRFRLSVHSRLALVTTAVLIIAGWGLFTIFEWSVTLAELPLPHRLINSLFLSVTPRTAGFYAIDYAQATDSTNFLTILFMFVGGSPGSTAGGIKTTTVALLVLLAWSRFRGRETTNIWGRTIPEETTQRAVGLALTAFAVLTVCIFLYTYTEHTGVAEGHARFLTIMFEAAGAFTTAGLSMNATATLSEAGQWITLFLMFVGRVGPLTFAAALALAAHRGRRDGYRYAHEDVVVG